jgi:hypothetical protein
MKDITEYFHGEKKMRDLIISAISTYDFDKVKPWVDSINSCGFSGKKVMIAHNITDESIRKFKDNDFEVWLTTNQRNKDNSGYHFADNFGYQVPATRHWFHWLFLKELKEDIRYVISTDSADVIFQSNPSEWLEKNLGDKKLNYGGEGLKYKDEDWGYNNMASTFNPLIQQHTKDNPIYNAGSMAGEFKTFIDFSLNVFLTIQYLREPIPDQAAVNLLLSLEPYKSITKFNDHDDTWACQCGTMMDPTKMDRFRPNLLSPEPVWKDGVMYNSKGEKYTMVHQYNRVPGVNEYIRNKYK